VNFPEKDPIITHTIQLRSRYSETDKMGYVYYGNFLEYFEVVRTELIRQVGLPYRKMEENGVMLPVVKAEVEYKRPVKYDELMDITVFIYDYPSVRLVTYYEVSTEGQDKPNTFGRVDLTFMDVVSRRPIRAPKEFNDGIRNYLMKQT